MHPARAYEIDEQAVSAPQFIALACDPAHSVVVEACAGSGKTWLLVARMLRLLLSGCEPSALLAITFTRKAAQEMRERLMALLAELASASEEVLLERLQERGVSASEAQRLIPTARSLYQRVLSSPQALSIDTFHSWFARLLKLAPLSSGVPHGYGLTDATGELRQEATRRFMQEVNALPEVRAALIRLYENAGASTTTKLLNAFVDKRAEWWAVNQNGAALALLRSHCAIDEMDEAVDFRLRLWQDQALLARVWTIARLLGQGSVPNQKRATAIEAALTQGPAVEQFDALYKQFLDEDDAARRNSNAKALLAALAQDPELQGLAEFNDEFNLVAEQLLYLRKRSCEPQVVQSNQDLFIVGQAYLEMYQAVKAEQRVFDFGDLEWHAWHLLNSEEHAAYLHSRLDARYRHILLDEFQDTNPLQWSIVRAWLEAYGDDAGQPSMFIVGDPKQSIYRFRRAEPRVFGAASALLKSRGAHLLRTSQTRRNGAAIVDVLDRAMAGNVLYAPQTTLSDHVGQVWRLPLVVQREESSAELAHGVQLRDPLQTGRTEQEDARRQDEGQMVAQAILRARTALTDAEGNMPAWKDVMVLVKKRAHLAAYEGALRSAGIPFVSDKRGGLLTALEVADLTALLRFLMTPADNTALAHALKSPVFGGTDDDLIYLAQYVAPNGGKTWWQRLQNASAAALSGSSSASMSGTGALSPALQRAARLLSVWLDAALHVPVHDLLDRILHEGDLVTRYAQSVGPLLRSQVIGNLEAFIELALNLDAGRYPSLPKFIDALATLKNGAQNDAPDEANIDPALDAVRILTIHSAKGLEARIVVLMDANGSEAAREDLGILCDWPQESRAPLHFSAFGRKAERGVMRDALFAQEESLKQQEDWNLLYVAATRAKELLIISGVAATRGADEDGLVAHNWYARLLSAPLLDLSEAQAPQSAPASDAALEQFEQSVFAPPLLTLPTLLTPITPPVSSAAIDEGIALHALLERITSSPDWPVVIPPAAALARWLQCDVGLAAVVREQAATILATPDLERFFNPQLYRVAYNELAIGVDQGMLRFDRFVMFEKEAWVLDYKRRLLASERADYHAQLSGYLAAAQAVHPTLKIRAALITVEGELVELDALSLGAPG